MTDTPTKWKNISVFLDDSPESARLGTYAATLAERFGSHLIGIHSITGVPGEHTGDSFARGKQAIDSVIARRRSAEHEESQAVAQHFAACATKRDVSHEFRVISNISGDEEAVVNSLHSDLVILGHPKPHGLPERWTADRLLIASGVPILIVPDAWTAKPLGGKAVVAWNGSREARRAIADAMPMLEIAETVTVLVVDSVKSPEKYGEDPGTDIATYLSRHGVHVDLEQVASGGTAIAKIIRSKAVEREADLIVIGAYSHARSAELIFGGVTRALLAKTPVPVLVSR